MDQRSEDKEREEFRERVRSMLSAMTLEELSYTLGRYCGKSNTILSIKKYGYIMPTDLVQEAFDNKAVESLLLQNN